MASDEYDRIESAFFMCLSYDQTGQLCKWLCEGEVGLGEIADSLSGDQLWHMETWANALGAMVREIAQARTLIG